MLHKHRFKLLVIATLLVAVMIIPLTAFSQPLAGELAPAVPPPAEQLQATAGLTTTGPSLYDDGPHGPGVAVRPQAAPPPDPELVGLSVGDEITGRRTAYSKHFYLGNDQFVAKISQQPVHYQDAQGQWQEIDPTLRRRAGGGYATEGMPLQSYLPARAGGAVEIRGRITPRPETPPITPGQLEEEAPLRLSPQAIDPIDVFAGWTPLAWRYSDAAGNHDELTRPRPTAGQAQGAVITYPDVMPNVNETYRVMAEGLKHELTLLAPLPAPASHLAGDITFDYVGWLDLPSGVRLYADGQAQTAPFTTQGAVEVRDEAGHLLLGLAPPLAYEAENRAETTGGSYSLWLDDDRLFLAWQTPAAWLLAPERQYPVVLDPTWFNNSIIADTTIYEAFPTTNYGSQSYLGVRSSSSSSINQRTLLQWPITGIPDYALINSTHSDDVKVSLYQYSSGSNAWLSLYQVTESWHSGYATWQRRNSTEYWNTYGGTYDSTTLASEWIDGTLWRHDWYSYPLRDMVALWRTNEELGFGPDNNGLLLKVYDESEYTNAKLFRSFNYGSNAPEINVVYATGPRALTDGVPVYRRVPSPDYYQTPAGDSFWKAIGLRPRSNTADYNLRLYDDSTYSTQLELGSRGGGEVDFVVIDQDSPDQAYYPLAYSYDGETGYYDLEYVQREAFLSPAPGLGDVYGPYTLSSSNVLKMWSMWVHANRTYCLRVDQTAGTGRLGAAIFTPGFGGIPDYYKDRNDAGVIRLANSAGQDVSLAYTGHPFISAHAYGLVVWNEDPYTSATFYLVGCSDVYLPIVLK